MLTAHFLAVTPDGCPEEIEAGPFTEERAKDALFAWEMNHGCPARVVTLSEQVEPTWFTVCATSPRPRHFVLMNNGREIGTLAEATATNEDLKGRVNTFAVFGLVPAKG